MFKNVTVIATDWILIINLIFFKEGYYAGSNDFASIGILDKYDAIVNIIKTDKIAFLYFGAKFIAL